MLREPAYLAVPGWPLRQRSFDTIVPERKIAKALSGRVEKCIGNGGRHRRQRRFSCT
jgi:hypothetical protein